MSHISTEIENFINYVNERFIVLDEKREIVIRLNREMLKTAVEAIDLINKGEIERVPSLINRCEKILEKISEIIEKYEYQDKIYLLKIVGESLREYVEATLLYSFITNGEIKFNFQRISHLGITPILEGIFDFIGEIRRYFLRLLIDNEIKKAKFVLDFINYIYNCLSKLKIRNYYIPSYKKRLDILRAQLDKCLEDYNFALGRVRL